MKPSRIIPVSDKHEIASPQGTMIVLWTIREHGPVSFARLYHLVYGYEGYSPSQLGFIERALSDLIVSRLVELGGIPNPSEVISVIHRFTELPDDVTIRVAPTVDRI